MLRILLLTAGSIGLTAPALAGTLFTAALANPVEDGTEIIANRAIWTCDGDTCVAELARKSPTVRACKQVAKEIGQLAGFSSENGELTAEELAECNSAAKG